MNDNANAGNEFEKKSIADMVNNYNNANQGSGETPEIQAKSSSIPTANNMNHDHFQSTMQKETDPDLIVGYEIVKLPSKGVFYENNLSEVEVEYMTSKDEDLLTTPSLIESGKVLDVLMKRKIKTKGVNPDLLLSGDRNAILLFLRTSSYGFNYDVEVTDPRTGVAFNETIDLSRLQYKELTEMPDELGYYDVFLPMRKKNVKIRLLTTGEDNTLFRTAEEIKEAYSKEFSEYNSMKLKASIVSIEGNTDRSYIDRFVDAMPAGDSLAVRKKTMDVQPDVDMKYEFTAKDGFKFAANLSVGVDFFFPGT